MYHALVRAQARRAFADLSAGRIARHLGRFSRDAVLRAHDAVGRADVFHGRSRIAEGFGRLYAAAPQHRFVLEDVWVKGGPHDTRIAVSWTDFARDGEGRAEVRRGMNRIRLAWGRVREEDIFIFPALDD
jgi:hypothetical protein